MSKRKTRTDEEKKLADDARLLRDWLAWHRVEREAALSGPHGAMCERLFYILKNLELKDATVLLAFVRGVAWTAVHLRTRETALHEINNAITTLRERHGLAPFDDGWPDGEAAFITIRNHLFPAQCAAPPGAKPSPDKQSNPEPELQES